jgi:hypothetical protein
MNGVKDIFKKKMKLELSFDDGNNLDLEILRLLTKYNLNEFSIFYIPSCCGVRKQKEDLVKEVIKNGCEVGGHTLNHIPIRYLKKEDKIYQIRDDKKVLENIIGKELIKFAYPKGWFCDKDKEAVKLCGYKEARTMEQWNTKRGNDFFEIPITFHFHPDKIEKFNEYLEKGFNEGYYHFVAHSWEIEKFNNWSIFEDCLKKINEYKSRGIK